MLYCILLNNVEADCTGTGSFGDANEPLTVRQLGNQKSNPEHANSTIEMSRNRLTQ